MTIYVPCPDIDRPSGGIKVIYRYVDLLNEMGFAAYVLHHSRGFRATWFLNNTQIAYLKGGRLLQCFYRESRAKERLLCRLIWKRAWRILNHDRRLHLLDAPTKRIETADYLFVPAIISHVFGQLAKGTRKIIFNQGVYAVTFKQHTLHAEPSFNPYFDKDVICALTVSQNNKEYLAFAYPELQVFRHHLSIDIDRFYYVPHKQKRIAYMPRKNPQHALQVINILRTRRNVSEYEFIPIDGKSEPEVAHILGESVVFLNFCYSGEGWPLPPAEAMAAGCLVIGYHGMGGMEYFRPEFSYSIPFGDIKKFAQTVEMVAQNFVTCPQAVRDKGWLAAKFIREHYSAAQEKADVRDFWNWIAQGQPS